MAEHDDAVSVMGDEDTPSKSSRTGAGASNPLARAWAWFGVQPAQTKVIILGVIVVIGVVIYMAVRGKKQVDTSQNQTTTGPFSPLGAYTRRHHHGVAPGTTPLPAPSGPNDGSIAAPSPAPVAAPTYPSTPTNTTGFSQAPPTVSNPQAPVIPVASAPVPMPTVTPGAMNLKGTNYEIDKVYQAPMPPPPPVPSAPNKDEATTAKLIYSPPAPTPQLTPGAQNLRGTNFLL